jgi:hypothetical protein
MPDQDLSRFLLYYFQASRKALSVTYSYGQKVIVKDFRGRSLPRRVWRDDGETVLVTSDEVFDLLKAGKTDLWPIGVPKSEVSIRRNQTMK